MFCYYRQRVLDIENVRPIITLCFLIQVLFCVFTIGWFGTEILRWEIIKQDKHGYFPQDKLYDQQIVTTFSVRYSVVLVVIKGEICLRKRSFESP